jgi:hypothetical protein
MRSRVGRMLGVIGIVASLLILCRASAGAVAGQPFEVIAGGLDNPRGLAFGPEGALYVMEAGRGGPTRTEPPVELNEGVYYVGLTGAVTRIWNGQQERIVTGLSSAAHQDGGFAFGPHDISFLGEGGAYVTVGDCLPLGNVSGGCGQLIHLKSEGRWETIADLTAYEVDNNPDGGTNPDGSPRLERNPYAVLALPDARIVTDAAGNTLLRVSPHGEISTLAVFPQRFVDAPPSLELPPGTQLPMDAVPTSVAVGPDGALYVSELTGFPFPVGGARIYRVVPGEAPQVYADGFTNVIDIVFEGDGSLLVLEIAKNSLLSGDPTGALIRLKPDGSRETLLSEGLVMPAAVAIGYDALVISNCGVCAGDGQVIRMILDKGE